MNKKLISVLEGIGAIVIILAVVLFVRHENAAKDSASSEVPPLTVSTNDSYAPTPTPEATAVPTFKESEYLGMTDEEMADYYSKIVWDEDFQRTIVDADTENHDDDPYYYQRIWLSMHPHFKVKGYDNIYYEPSAGELINEDNIQYNIPSYENKELVYDYGEGTVTVGTNTPSREDGIQLDFACSEASADTPMGFYLQAESIPPLSDFGPNDLKTASEQDVGSHCFIIPTRFYEKVIPAAPTDTLMGTVWRNDMSAIWGTYPEDRIHVRMINLKTGELVTVFVLNIAYTDGTYQIAGISGADVLETGDLTESEREYIVNDAIGYFTDASRGPTVSVADPATAIATAAVEKVPRTYFSTLYDAEQEPIRQSDYVGIDTYAVNLNFDGVGVLTAYYGPTTQVLYGFNSPTAPGSTDKELVMIGFDALSPANEDTIMRENGFVP